MMAKEYICHENESIYLVCKHGIKHPILEIDMYSHICDGCCENNNGLRWLQEIYKNNTNKKFIENIERILLLF